MSDLDFEKMWRRVDRECLGQVLLFPLAGRIERERGGGGDLEKVVRAGRMKEEEIESEGGRRVD